MEQTTTRKPFHQQVADQLIEKIQKGTAPWQKPWVAGHDIMPVNPTTGNRYRGVNTLMLMMQDFQDNRWMTYKQARKAGYQVKSGEHGTPVQYWVFTENVDRIDPATGEPALDGQGNPIRDTHRLERPKLIISHVFNAEQIDGIPPQERKTFTWNPHERAEEILQNTGIPIKHDQNNRAFYAPVLDEIHLPPKDQFPDAEKYYDTALHELGHGTGHESRLNRNFKNSYGEPDYAREELVAEIASMMMCGEIGIQPDTNRNAAYVGSWVKQLQDHPMEICRAAQQAEMVRDYVIGLERERHPERDYSIEEKSRTLLSAAPDVAVEYFLAGQNVLSEARENPDNVHTFQYRDTELFALKGRETLYSVPNHNPAAGEEFIIQSRVTAYDHDGMEYEVKLEEALRRLETGGNEHIAPVQALDITPTGREMPFPVDWTGELTIRGCAEEQDSVRIDVPDEDIQFYGVYAVREDGTEQHVKDYDTREDAESYQDLMAHAYKRQTGQEAELPRQRTDVQAYINVPYADRREARARGAEWDGDAKSWFIPMDMDPARIPDKWPVHDPAVTRAEQEARQAERAANKSERLYINVPKAEKDDAKRLGARWDRQAVSWYVPTGINPDPLTAKWPAHEPDRKPTLSQTAIQGLENGDRVYLLVPYREKDEAKRAGALFDRDNKQWYVGPKGDLDKLTRWLPENQISLTPDISPRDEFAVQLRSMGAVVDGSHPIADGQSHRIAVDGDKGTEKSGFYVLHPDGHPAGYVKNNRTQEETRWAAKGYELDPVQRAALHEAALETVSQRSAEQSALFDKTAARLQKQLQNLKQPESPTPYMEAKGIQVHEGVYLSGASTCIPAHTVSGEVRSVQYIQKDGTKRFAKNSERSGCFHAVGGLDSLRNAPALVISEGYATAATLSETLGHATVAAFDAGNLLAVAKNLHEAMPDKPIVIAGDDDRRLEAENKPNVGRIKAQEAAEAVHGIAVFPTFAEDERQDQENGLTDFNDLAVKSTLGVEAVRSQVTAAMDKAREHHEQEQDLDNEKTRSAQELARV